MENYRQLTTEEIAVLENNNCWAEDWNRVLVKPGFRCRGIHRVVFYGDIRLGVCEKTVEVTKGFEKNCGISDATLRNVEIGDNCLIEKVGNFINNYVIGNECYISNISTLQTTENATFGEGTVISVLNEMGDGNIKLTRHLNAQLAALMVKNYRNADFRKNIDRLINNDIECRPTQRGTVGDRVRIVNTKEIENTVIADDCEVNGASRVSNCTLVSSAGAPVFIGAGVICEDSIVSHGCRITNSVKMHNCFVGEACEITSGFTAESSVFFANSYMANGEACAAFCGPFTASHHKSSLLIGGQYSFYNAGSSTNFSNHAYKMGPMHYGILERGSKTASGAYVLMPCNIGAFSVCFGKLMHHPDTRNLPFSYLFAYGDDMYLVPGRNITTVGLYRDIKKWPKRDRRTGQFHKSIINFNWLSPFTVGEIIKGKAILEALRESSGRIATTYNYHDYLINASSLNKGIKYYDIALRIYMGAVLKRALKEGYFGVPTTGEGLGEWDDLSGMLLPMSHEEAIVADISNGRIDDVADILVRFQEIDNRYKELVWTWTYRMILDYYNLEEISPLDIERIHDDYVVARRAWIAEIRKDALKEFAMGDVEREVLDDFLNRLDHETDYEN